MCIVCVNNPIDMLDDPRIAVATGSTLRERQRHSHADDKQEQRHDEVDEMEALPFHVFHLGHATAGQRTLGRMENAGYDPLAADDPEHIEAAKSVEGDKTAGYLRLLNIMIHDSTLVLVQPEMENQVL